MVLFPLKMLFIPMNDSEYLDWGAQSILIGEKVFFGNSTEKPFYMFFLAGIYKLLGQDYHTVTTFQVLLLSFIPVLYFLIGKLIVDRFFGILLAFFTISQEFNAIAMIRQDIAVHSKILMTEPIVELMLAMLIFATYRYLTRTESRNLYAIFIGVIFGLAGLTRLNTFLLFFIIFGAISLIHIIKKSTRRNITSLTLIIISFVIVIAPYSIYTARQSGQPFFLYKVSGVLNRHGTGVETKEIVESAIENITPKEPIPESETPPAPKTKNSLPILLMYFNHVVHNELMTMVEFPIDLGFLPIEKYTKTPIWFASNIWDGKFTPLQAVFFAINLCALSIGLGWSIKHYGYLGTIPIVFHLGYNLTNAAALTSGGALCRSRRSRSILLLFIRYICCSKYTNIWQQ